MVQFVIERRTPLPPDEAWRRVTAWERHGDAVPLTHVREATSPPTRTGSVVVARSALGPVGFDDVMRVARWQPPEPGRLDGVCVLVKTGRVVAGRAEIAVWARGEGSVVRWCEELRPRGVPEAVTRPFGGVARWVFGRALDSLLLGPPGPA